MKIYETLESRHNYDYVNKSNDYQFFNKIVRFYRLIPFLRVFITLMMILQLFKLISLFKHYLINMRLKMLLLMQVRI